MTDTPCAPPAIARTSSPVPQPTSRTWSPSARRSSSTLRGLYPSQAASTVPTASSEGGRFLVLAPHLTERPGHLPQRGVGAHRVQDRRHEVVTAPGGVAEARERSVHGALLTLAAKIGRASGR